MFRAPVPRSAPPVLSSVALLALAAPALAQTIVHDDFNRPKVINRIRSTIPSVIGMTTAKRAFACC